MDYFQKLAGGLIVSCQAPEGDPLCGPIFMSAMAKAAELGGASGIRCGTPGDIQAIREITQLPIVGSYKIWDKITEVHVTPTFNSAKLTVEAGADIVGMDATSRPRGDGIEACELIKKIKAELKVPVMADVSTLEEAQLAANAGADFITTALAGYTSYSKQMAGPDFELLVSLVKEVDVPIIAEGRIITPEDAYQALKLGAFAVLVGTAISRPEKITERFVEKTSKVRE